MARAASGDMYRWAVLCIAVVGCGRASHHPAAPCRDPLAALVQTETVRMHARLGAAREMEESIALGELGMARRQADGIDNLDEPMALRQWRPFLTGMREAAHAVAIADSLDAAARSAGQLGGQCGRCHEAIGARVGFPAEPAPSVPSRMSGHRWAAMQMWEGLIGPDQDRWHAGATFLAAIPANELSQTMTRGLGDDLDDVSRLRALADRALTISSSEERSELYGRLLAVCSHCHAILRDSWRGQR